MSGSSSEGPQIKRYRKRPVVVEAVQYDGTKASFWAIWDWMDGDDPDSPMLGYEGPDDDHPEGFGIKTREGTMTASPGDWVIRGTRGEFYPCKPDIFPGIYEPAEIADARDAGNPSPNGPAITPFDDPDHRD